MGMEPCSSTRALREPFAGTPAFRQFAPVAQPPLVVRALRERFHSRSRMRATPHTMALSAMLKLGQTHSCSPIMMEQRMKSRTPP